MPSASQQDRGLDLCRRHAAPLLRMASLMLDDADVAAEVVSDTIAAACQAGGDGEPSDYSRTQLARSVYRRCMGRLATRERFAMTDDLTRRATVRAPTSTLATLSLQHRAAIALIVFGGHDLAQAAMTLNLSPATIVTRLRECLAATTAAAANLATPSADAT